MDRVSVLNGDASGGGAVRRRADVGWSIALLACALAFMVAETLLGRWFSHARIDSGAGGIA
jgi:hypothetical protein